MQPIALCCLLSVVLILTTWRAKAEVRRVPQDYASIQAALDATGTDDTVLVALGTYAEELTTPPVRFWLIGDVAIDTGAFPRPVIDPSTLDSAQWRHCMTVPNGSEPIIERMGFVNRAPMFPRDHYLKGGVLAGSPLPLTFRFCSFDSVTWAIAPDTATRFRRYVVEDCRFTYAPRVQVWATPPAESEVRRCYFHGYHLKGDFVDTGPNSIVEECVFTGDSVWRAVAFWGLETNTVLRNCIFMSMDSCHYVFQVRNTANAVVEGNVFTDIRTGWLDFAFLSCHYDQPMVFRHNVLRNISTYGDGVGTDMNLDRDQGSSEFVARVDSNLFVNYASGMNNNRGKALGVWSRITATGNHFVNLQPDSVPTVDILPGISSPGGEFRYNQFEVSDYAFGNEYGYGADARWNWWGHASGPFNLIHNPMGQGARIDDQIQFDPWCPDTNCFLSVPGIGKPLPKEFVFEAYPNPFNAALHLTLIPSQVGIVKLEIFDLLGRRVQEIWHGPLAFQKEITFDASALSSGIYFARATDVISRKNLATAKLVLLR